MQKKTKIITFSTLAVIILGGIYTYSANYAGQKIETLVLKDLKLEQNPNFTYQRGIFSSHFAFQDQSQDNFVGNIWHLGIDLGGLYAKLNGKLNYKTRDLSFDIVGIQHSFDLNKLQDYLLNKKRDRQYTKQLITDILRAGIEIKLQGGNKEINNDIVARTDTYENKNGFSLFVDIKLKTDGEQDISNYVSNLAQTKISGAKANLFLQTFIDLNNYILVDLNHKTNYKLDYKINDISISPWFDSESYNLKELTGSSSGDAINDKLNTSGRLDTTINFMDKEQISHLITNLSFIYNSPLTFEIKNSAGKEVNLNEILSGNQWKDIDGVFVKGTNKLSLNLQNEKGNSAFNLEYTIENMKFNEKFGQLLEKGLKGEFSLDLSKPQLEAMLATAMPSSKFRGFEKLIVQQVISFLNNSVKHGYLQLNGDNFKGQGKIKENSLIINDKVIVEELSQF